MSEFFDVRPEHWDKTFRKHIPASYVSKRGRVLLFDRRSIKAIVEGVRDEAKSKSTIANGDDLLAGNVDTPELERYRRLRADMVERDLAERDRDLLRTSDLETVIGTLANRLRRAGEQIGQRFGADAQAILDEALDDVEQELESSFDSTTATT